MKVREALNLYNLHSNPEQLKGHDRVDMTRYQLFKVVPFQGTEGYYKGRWFYTYEGNNVEETGIFVNINNIKDKKEILNALKEVGIMRYYWEYRVNTDDWCGGNEVLIDERDEGRWRHKYVLRQAPGLKQ